MRSPTLNVPNAEPTYTQSRQSRQTCAAQRWTARFKPQASVTLRPPEYCQPQRWRAQLAAVQRALATRGALPTSVVIALTTRGALATSIVVVLTHRTQATALRLLSDSLRGVRGVATLRVLPTSVYTPPDRTTVSDFIRQAVSALPSLRTLTLECACALPGATFAPRVTSLSFRTTPFPSSIQDSDIVSASSYVKQLTFLEVTLAENSWHTSCRIPWSRLFTQRAQSLTKLTTNTQLNDELLLALLGQAPNLQELR